MLAVQLAKEYRIPAPPPLTYRQTQKAEAAMLRNGISPDDYLEAAGQLWRDIRAKDQIYPKPYLLLSPFVIQLALSNRADRETRTTQRHEAVQKTLNDWVFRYQETLNEIIAWLEWDGVHRQFPSREYSCWKSGKMPLK
jgi:hypothetical protein